jgi:hypothetical protein
MTIYSMLELSRCSGNKPGTDGQRGCRWCFLGAKAGFGALCSGFVPPRSRNNQRHSSKGSQATLNTVLNTHSHTIYLSILMLLGLVCVGVWEQPLDPRWLTNFHLAIAS